MNPFDGQNYRYYCSNTSNLPNSYQTAHAGAWLDIQVNTAVYAISLQERGPPSVLHFVSNDNKHDRSIHRTSILGLRLHLAIP